AKAVNRLIEQHQAEDTAGAAARPAALWAGRRLVDTARLLGLFLEPQEAAPPSGADGHAEVIALLIEVRSLAKKNKNFATADLIRDRLGQTGVTLEDRAGETSYRVDQPADDLFEQATTLLVEVRDACKRQKDFATADLIRDKLTEAGTTVEDRPDGATWRRT
ncbi:MAG: hypothetical protein GY778_18655, partial [bacterium]|nr:hypothetical protein [bacterium]